MSDIDQKNIPTLDDVIDDDSADNDIDIIEEKDSLDLFETNNSDSPASSSTEEEALADAALDDTADPDENIDKTIQYSLQHSYEEAYTGLDLQLGIETKSDDTFTPEDSAEPEHKITIEPLVLEQIVEGVVKQMMPDLEQQLRFLIQQSLEEKLPEETFKLTSDTDSES